MYWLVAIAACCPITIEPMPSHNAPKIARATLRFNGVREKGIRITIFLTIVRAINSQEEGKIGYDRESRQANKSLLIVIEKGEDRQAVNRAMR